MPGENSQMHLTATEKLYRSQRLGRLGAWCLCTCLMALAAFVVLFSGDEFDAGHVVPKWHGVALVCIGGVSGVIGLWCLEWSRRLFREATRDE